uniref:Uncharacterized protein n=1 Tax=Anopheles culicifacies TaxID=139723 RepID=A0A182MPM3_9DIPT
MPDIPTTTLNNIITHNKYLIFPRLSSQDMLDSVCPAEWNRPRKRLCVVLVTENTSSHEGARTIMRKIAHESAVSRERVRFAYIYQERQNDFIGAISKHNHSKDTLLQIVIFWRRDNKQIRYEWVNDVVLQEDTKALENYTQEQHFNYTKQKMDSVILRLLRSSEAPSYETEVKALLDEHAESAVMRMLNRLLLTIEHTMDNLGPEHILPAVSVIGTVVCICIVGYLMSYLLHLEEKDIQQKKSKHEDNSSESREIKINPRNCIGTVIALNGHRKYFCMYHAKHPESNRGTKSLHLLELPNLVRLRLDLLNPSELTNPLHSRLAIRSDP